MKVLAFVFITLLAFIDPWLVRKINTAKSQAETAYKKGDYKTAISKYRYLIDSLEVQEDEISLNLAHAYYLDKDTAQAKSTYGSIAESSNGRVKSKAQQQLGVMANQSAKPEEALAHFKDAIKADPANMDARYNYEMLKRKVEEQRQKDQKNQKDKSDKNKNQEPSEYAKRLKEQADRLVQQHKYLEALILLLEGQKKDETVSAYQDYMNRLGEVTLINKN